MALLSDDEITALLADHPQWRRRGRSVQRELEFKELADAGRFVARATAHLPPRDPYPEFVLHDFKLVTVRIGHENSAGMSVADVRLIAELDALIAAPAPAEATSAAPDALVPGASTGTPPAAPGSDSAPSPEPVLAGGVQDASRPPGPASTDAPASAPPPSPAGAEPSLVARLVSGAGLLATGVVLGRLLAWRTARRRLLRRFGLA